MWLTINELRPFCSFRDIREIILFCNDITTLYYSNNINYNTLIINNTPYAPT